MKHSKPMILLLTVLLTAIAVVFGRNEIGMRNFPFSVMVHSLIKLPSVRPSLQKAPGLASTPASVSRRHLYSRLDCGFEASLAS